MKVPVYRIDGSREGTVTLPPVFSTPFRPDVIHKAYVILSTHRLQPKGTDPEAGERTSAASLGVGLGIARIARVKGERYSRARQAGGVASVVGGRVAHPPRSEKKLRRRINCKERRLALASAIAATAVKDLVSLRGHRVDRVEALPIVVSDEVEEILKTRDLRFFFNEVGLEEEIGRINARRKSRSGKPRMRGRAKKEAKGPLFIVAEDRGVGKAVRGFPGVECVLVKDLSVLHLAPGSHPGRLTVWSKSALKALPEGVVEVAERIAA